MRAVLRDQWLLAYRRRHERPAHLEAGPPFNIARPRREVDWADPFLLERNGLTYVFFEEWGPERNRGVICYLTLDDDGRVSEPKVALDLPYHTSYPFVFERDGETWMVPETSAAGLVQLYRAVDFPGEWRLEKVLLEDIAAVDPTLFEHDGKLWLFVNVAAPGGTKLEELCVYWSDSLLGEWHPHPLNPVVSDVRTSRPAGRLYRDGEDLIRPGQDCSSRYGYAVALNRIEVLTETDYRERQVGMIEPGFMAGNLASHAYNFDERWEFVDSHAGRFKYAILERLWPGGPGRLSAMMAGAAKAVDHLPVL